MITPDSRVTVSDTTKGIMSQSYATFTQKLWWIISDDIVCKLLLHLSL